VVGYIYVQSYIILSSTLCLPQSIGLSHFFLLLTPPQKSKNKLSFKMVNLRLGSIAPDFEAETSTGDIKVSLPHNPILFDDQVADVTDDVNVDVVLRLGW